MRHFASLAPLAWVALVVAPIAAHADSFVELAGGITVPLGNDDWTDVVESSPKLALRAGAVGENRLGGMLSVDWTPYNTDAMSTVFPGGSTSISAHRFRMLANLVIESPIASRVTARARIGAGIDIAHASFEATSIFGRFSAKDTDIGPAFEAGAGVWFTLGSVQVGGELAIPIGHHNHRASQQGEITFDYTSYDLDLMFGVKFLMP
jgi:hypothetical protein